MKVNVANCTAFPCRLPINRRVKIITEFQCLGKFACVFVCVNSTHCRRKPISDRNENVNRNRKILNLPLSDVDTSNYDYGEFNKFH